MNLMTLSVMMTTDDGCFRGWFINPVAVTHWWLVLVAIVPALLATILVFLDQQITAVIVNRSEHKLKVPLNVDSDVVFFDSMTKFLKLQYS